MEKAPLIAFYVAFSAIIWGEFIDNWFISFLVGIPVTAIFAVLLWLLTIYVLRPLVVGWEEIQKRRKK